MRPDKSRCPRGQIGNVGSLQESDRTAAQLVVRKSPLSEFFRG